MKHYLSVLPATVVVSTVAFAQSTPETVVQRAVEGTVGAMKADPQARGGDMARIAAIVQSHFLPATDFQRTTRIAVGDAWTQATPDQQKQLYEQFTLLLTRTYAVSLSQLRDQQVGFRFAPASAGSGANDAVVQSHVLSGNSDDAVDYRLTRAPSGWKIYDIDMSGAWLVQVYQKQFAAQIRQGGIDGLIRFLARHNALTAD